MTLYTTRISLEARGALATLIEQGAHEFTVADIQAIGARRDQAYRIRSELLAAGLAEETNSRRFVLKLPEIRISGKQEVLQNSAGSNGELPEIRKNDSENDGSMGELPVFRISGKQELGCLHIDHESLDQSVTQIHENPEIRKKPQRPRKPPAPPEIKALYPAVFGLCESPQKGVKSMACRNLARDLYREFAATSEQIAGFRRYWRDASTAANVAAAAGRNLTAPMPRQVYEAWPSYRRWLEAQERRRASRPLPPPPVEPEPERPTTPMSVLAELFPHVRGTFRQQAAGD